MNTHESPIGIKYVNGKRNGIGEPSTLGRKSPKFLESAEFASDKTAACGIEDNMSINDNVPTFLEDYDIYFDNCNLTEVIKKLQKIAQAPNASKLNIAFPRHITDALCGDPRIQSYS